MLFDLYARKVVATVLRRLYWARNFASTTWFIIFFPRKVFVSRCIGRAVPGYTFVPGPPGNAQRRTAGTQQDSSPASETSVTGPVVELPAVENWRLRLVYCMQHGFLQRHSLI